MILSQSSESSQQSQGSKRQTRQFVLNVMKNLYQKIKILKNTQRGLVANQSQQIMYTSLRNGYLEIQWHFLIQKPNLISVSTFYSLMNSLMIPLKTQNLNRLKQAVQKKNLQLDVGFLKYIVKNDLSLCLNAIYHFSVSQKFKSNFKKFIHGIERQMKSSLTYFIPYLTNNSAILGPIKDKSLSENKMKQHIKKLQQIRCYSQQMKIHGISSFDDYKHQMNEKILEISRCSNLLQNQRVQNKYFDLQCQKYSQSQQKTGFKQEKADRIVIPIKIQKILSQKAEVIGESQFSQITKQLYIFQYLRSITIINKPSKSQNLIKKQQMIHKQQRYLAKKIPRKAKENDEKINYSDKIAKWSYQNEISLIKYIRNSNCDFIAKYYLNLVQPDTLYLQVYRKSLLDLLNDSSCCKIKLSLSKKLQIFLGIVSGVQFLNKRNILHRDLKLTNILISEQIVPKMIDFGSSCQLCGSNDYSLNHFPLTSTEGYYFPYKQLPTQIKQMYKQYEYNKHCNFDIYSIGTLIQSLFSAELKSQSDNFVTFIRSLVTSCHQLIPDRRPSATIIKQIIQNFIHNKTYFDY